jgi:hypothetical protein
MKIKNIITSFIAGASLLAFVGAASAATVYSNGTGNPTTPTSDINIYGASAQYTFWKTEFPLYLQAAGCTLGMSGTTTDGKHFIQQATCGGNLLNFRVSSKASYDGPLAVDFNTTNPSRDTSCVSGGFGGANTRPMIDPSTCSGGTCAIPVASATTCVPVTLGASDVQVQDFVQFSSGALLGPNGGAFTVRNFANNPITLSANTVDYCRPEAIPFEFYVNSSVVTSPSVTLTNISSAEAKMLFSGIITDWSQLQSTAMVAQPVTLCLRHAGSGTHATMDAFMRPQTLVKSAQGTTTSTGYKIFFNDGASDLMRCVNGISGTWSGAGAIGYADADQSLSSYPNTARITYDNILPITANVDDYTHSFVSIQNLYASTTTAANNVFIDLCTYASQPSTITAVNPNWSASCHMKHIKNSNFGNFLTNAAYLNSNCN